MLRRELPWQAEQSLSQRLSARWAAEQGSANAAAAKAAQQGTRKSQHLAKVRASPSSHKVPVEHVGPCALS